MQRTASTQSLPPSLATIQPQSIRPALPAPIPHTVAPLAIDTRPSYAESSERQALVAPPLHTDQGPATQFQSVLHNSTDEDRQQQQFRHHAGTGRLRIPRAQPKCVHCHTLGHGVQHCNGPPDREGYILGCPRCNEPHWYDSCTTSNRPKPGDDYRFLVKNRHGKPQIRTMIDIRSISGFYEFSFRPLTPQMALSKPIVDYHNHFYGVSPNDDTPVEGDLTWDTPYDNLGPIGTLCHPSCFQRELNLAQPSVRSETFASLFPPSRPGSGPIQLAPPTSQAGSRPQPTLQKDRLRASRGEELARYRQRYNYLRLFQRHRSASPTGARHLDPNLNDEEVNFRIDRALDNCLVPDYPSPFAGIFDYSNQ